MTGAALPEPVRERFAGELEASRVDLVRSAGDAPDVYLAAVHRYYALRRVGVLGVEMARDQAAAFLARPLAGGDAERLDRGQMAAVLEVAGEVEGWSA